jgi:hypothetical protein
MGTLARRLSHRTRAFRAARDGLTTRRRNDVHANTARCPRRRALLLFPTFPDGALDVLPRSGSVPTLKAREWICGDAPLPLPVHVDGVTGQIARPNVGVGLVGAVARRAATDDHIANLRRTDPGTPEAVESTHRMIESFVEQLSSLKAQITEAQRALWGEADA